MSFPMLVSSRAVGAFLAFAVAVLGSGCPKAFDCGGLSGDAPTVDSGKGSATVSTGEAFTNKPATWTSGSFAGVVVGALAIGASVDETGSTLDSLVSDGAFPICVLLGEKDGKTTEAADFNEGNTAVTDKDHTGNLAIDKLDGDFLEGRFAVTVKDAGDGSSIAFTDGVFKATRQ